MSFATELANLATKVGEHIDVVKGQFSKWDDAVKAQIGLLEDWRKSNDVSFSANHFEWGSKQSLIFNTVLVADRVETNVGDGYNNETGIFTAPADGSYLFASTVAISTYVYKNDDSGEIVDFSEAKWHEDIMINLNHYGVTGDIVGNGDGADKIGEIWIGEEFGDADGNTPKCYRKSGSTTAVHYLKKGERVCLEFVKWNKCEEGDGVSVSLNFSGVKVA